MSVLDFSRLICFEHGNKKPVLKRKKKTQPPPVTQRKVSPKKYRVTGKKAGLYDSDDY
jgi:hypothetical protein